jgi:DnaK suppressor protein
MVSKSKKSVGGGKKAKAKSNAKPVRKQAAVSGRSQLVKSAIKSVSKPVAKPGKKVVSKAKANVPAKKVTAVSRPVAKSSKQAPVKRAAAAVKAKPVAKQKAVAPKAKASVARKVAAKASAGTSKAPVVKPKSVSKAAVEAKDVAPSRSAGSAPRRGKDKEKNVVKSPFSHTDHASVFRGVEARKAAARAKQARMASTQATPKKGVARRLTDKQLSEFEEMLLRIRAELLRQIAYLRGVSLTRSDEVNPEEDGTDAFERQLALKLAAGEGDSIFEIDEALDRIRQTTYGVCGECGCLIPSQRLKALPFARRCVECQSVIEQGPNVSEHRYF